MINKTKDVYVMDVNIDIPFLRIQQLLRKDMGNMSQCLMIQNKNGCVLLSDSALTSVDENNNINLISLEHSKVFKGDTFIWTHAGLLEYEDDIICAMNNKQFSMEERIYHVKTIMNEAKKHYSLSYPISYQLIASEIKNGKIYSYMYMMTKNRENMLNSSEENTIVQPIGLYSKYILDKHMEKYVENMEIQQMVSTGTYIIQECKQLDKEINKGIFVNGDVLAISLDKHGNITTYINGQEKEF